MRCPKCGKESSNVRVCGFCQTPFSVGESARRTEAAAGGFVGAVRDSLAGWSPARRWGLVGLLLTFAVAYLLIGREKSIPAGVVLPDLAPTAMTVNEAKGTLATMHATAQVEERDGELRVTISAATLPQRRPGLLALAQQYARADELVQGRKRLISFLDPEGKPFARSDPDKGVMLTR